MTADHASIECCTSSKAWLLSPGKDFWLIHSGAGLLILPLVLLAQYFPQTWAPLYFWFVVLISRPHMAATWIRLFDPECRQYMKLLVIAAPIFIGISLAFLTVNPKMLPLVILAWLVGVNWHNSRQNFGIMRSYLRLAGLNCENLINRLAGVVANVLPMACMLIALCTRMPKTFMGYQITLPPNDILLPVTWILSIVAVVSLVGYGILEISEWRRGGLCPGRVLSVASGTIINALAWQFVSDILWSHFIVTFWHSLQYLVYVSAFRKQPPPGAQLLKLSKLHYLGMIVLVSAALCAGFEVFRNWIILLFPAFHLTMSFHHYLADTFIWRRARRQPELRAEHGLVAALS